ncbi:MAG: FprA family A-type flavoprotein, partial [Candidatus Syntrophosphaera sp.]
HLTSELIDRGIEVKVFELTSTDIGELAMSLVDAATIVIGTPAVLVGAHPMAAYAAFLANALRPKTKFAAIIGSYGWGTKAVEQISSMIPNLKAEILDTVLCKGKPDEKTYAALEALAEKIKEKHTGL